jgi:ribokinase
VSEGRTPGRVAVVGSANVDLVVPVEHLPAAGETVLGGDHLRAAGGKGGNQAVAAARLGCEVSMVARLGDDEHGRLLRSSLVEAGVDVAHVLVTPDAPSGLALITVDAAGENTIAVSPGANARLAVGDVEAARPLLEAAAVTLLQLEVDLAVVAAAAAAARGIVVLNPAPAAPLPEELLRQVSVLVPNRSELGALAGVREPRSVTEVIAAARRLPTPPRLVVTLGADGAVVIEEGDAVHLPALAVEAVDATGAGDAFCGGLADGLARGWPLRRAAAWATRVAGIATTRWGAQAGMPDRDEVEAHEPR